MNFSLLPPWTQLILVKTHCIGLNENILICSHIWILGHWNIQYLNGWGDVLLLWKVSPRMGLEISKHVSFFLLPAGADVEFSTISPEPSLPADCLAPGYDDTGLSPWKYKQVLIKCFAFNKITWSLYLFHTKSPFTVDKVFIYRNCSE